MPKKIEKPKPINILEIKRSKKPLELFIRGKPIKDKKEFDKLFKGRLLPFGLEGNIPEGWFKGLR